MSTSSFAQHIRYSSKTSLILFIHTSFTACIHYCLSVSHSFTFVFAISPTPMYRYKRRILGYVLSTIGFTPQQSRHQRSRSHQIPLRKALRPAREARPDFEISEKRVLTRHTICKTSNWIVRFNFFFVFEVIAVSKLRFKNVKFRLSQHPLLLRVAIIHLGVHVYSLCVCPLLFAGSCSPLFFANHRFRE